MQITSVTKPPVSFKIAGNQVTFYANITKGTEIDGSTGQEITLWTYDQYSLPVRVAANTAAQIAENYGAWLEKAKDYERAQEAQKVRAYRDKLLNDCDLIHCNAANWAAMGGAQKTAWQEYKQNLRDVTAQEGFPYHVAFPTRPE